MAAAASVPFRHAVDDTSNPGARHRGTRILSVVCVVDKRVVDPVRVLADVHEAMRSLATPVELVVVLNGADDDTVQLVQTVAQRLPCTQAYVLKRRVAYSTALLAGLENAIGDWIETIDLSLDGPVIIRSLFESAVANHSDVVLGVAPKLHRSVVDAFLSSVFHWLFKRLHGFTLRTEAPTTRLFSRAVLNRVLQHDSPLVALETLTAFGGYKKSVVTHRQLGGQREPLKERILIRWRILIGINAMPLRLANLLCGAGACAAVSYSAYVVLIYLVKQDVVPGWTTVSLILSCMFLMLSLVLWLLSEYMIMLLDAGARRPRYEMMAEFGSQQHSLGETLNVESEL